MDYFRHLKGNTHVIRLFYVTKTINRKEHKQVCENNKPHVLKLRKEHKIDYRMISRFTQNIFMILLLFGVVQASTYLSKLPAKERQIPPFISYLHPRPSSQFISPHSTILLRFNLAYQIGVHNIRVDVAGTRSGQCVGDITFSDDSRTLIFKPRCRFAPGETVSVTIRSADGRHFLSYDFAVSPMSQVETNRARRLFDKAEPLSKPAPVATVGRVRSINGIDVPGDFPRFQIQINQSDKTAPGYLFFGLRGSYFMMLKNDGTPYFYEKSNDFLMDFKVQGNGRLSRLVDNVDNGERYFSVLDEQLNDVDAFAVEHGYETDHHDFVLLPNGHALLIAGDYQRVDMSQLVPGGKTNAAVRGCHVQELDSNKNVVFQWNCWDHIPITDAVHENLQANSIDYLHMNSVALDFDGHIIVSCRNTSQCIKINRDTGDVIWILGGQNSSFDFINDPDQNSYQHHFQAVPDQPLHYTLFDNGNKHTPHYSRAVEFKLDTTAWTAERVWQYRPESDYAVSWLGSVQRLSNGNTMINWTGGGLPFATEVDPDGQVVYQARNRDSFFCYRTFRFDWSGVAAKPRLFLEAEHDRVILIFHKFGDTAVTLYKIYHGISENDLTPMATSLTNRYDATQLENYTRHYFKVTAVGKDGRESEPSEMQYIDVNFFEENKNLVLNGDFAAEWQHWDYSVTDDAHAQFSVDNDECQMLIVNGGDAYDDIQLAQTNLAVYKTKKYQFEFEAYADTPRAIEAKITNVHATWKNYSAFGFTALTKAKKHYIYNFTMTEETDLNAKVLFNCGLDDADVYIDNVSLKAVSATDATAPGEKAVDEFELAPNYPNPFNSSTTLSYRLPRACHVKLTICNLLGHHVATLVDAVQEGGEHRIVWNGMSARGKFVAGGLYFARLNTKDFSATIKIILAR